MFAQLPSGHTVTFDGAFLCLVDSGKGRSITNAAEDVIRHITARGWRFDYGKLYFCWEATSLHCADATSHFPDWCTQTTVVLALSSGEPATLVVTIPVRIAVSPN